MKLLNKLTVLGALMLSQCLVAPVASAQKNDFPNKPLNFIVPFPPGGAD